MPPPRRSRMNAHSSRQKVSSDRKCSSSAAREHESRGEEQRAGLALVSLADRPPSAARGGTCATGRMRARCRISLAAAHSVFTP